MAPPACHRLCFVVALLLAALLPCTGDTMLPALTHKLAQPGTPLRLVGFGDSITGIYYHTGGLRAWPEMLGLALQRLYPDHPLLVVNAGQSGDSTPGALARLDAQVLSHKPDLVVVMFGMNDCARLALDEYRANLRQIVSRLRAGGAETILCTPNAIADATSRSPEKLAAFAQTVREVAAELHVPLVDFYAAFSAIRAQDERAAVRLMSDSIHPNMNGHQLFAELLAREISGREISLADVEPRPGLPRLKARLQAAQPVRVLAMSPYDVLIAPALQALYPQAQVQVQAWPVEGQTLAQLEEQAKARGWWAFNQKPDLPRPDLVVVAVPASASADTYAAAWHHYTWVLNWSLAFARREWDCFAVLPEVGGGKLGEAEQANAALGRAVVQAQDIPYLGRAEGEQGSAAQLLEAFLRAQLAE